MFHNIKESDVMERIRSFSCDGLEITNCIFRRSGVEICYICEFSHDKDELREQLADHLKISNYSHLIKMTKLRAKPIYKETIIKPGETANVYPEGSGKIGAFVHVSGRGNHALLSGHGRSPGDVLFQQNGRSIGVVRVALHPPPKQTGDYSYRGYLDVALAKLDKQDGYIGQVSSESNGPLHLMEQPMEAVEGMQVRRFDANGNAGRVDSTAYIRYDENLRTDWRLISVSDSAGGPIHEEGDSGVLVVYDAPNEGRVAAVGMLVGIEELHLDDKEKTIRRTSLAVSLTNSFKALQGLEYCRERVIKFAR